MNAKAEFAIGFMYDSGDDGIKIDIMKAFSWFQRAAEKGYTPAQFYLGCYYEYKSDVRRFI